MSLSTAAATENGEGAGATSRRRGWKRAWTAVLLATLLIAVLMQTQARWVAWSLSRQTGFTLRIDALSANPLSGRIDLRGAVVENPLTFDPRPLLHISQIEVVPASGGSSTARRRYERVTIDLPLVYVVTNTDGTTNVDLFVDRVAEWPGRLLIAGGQSWTNGTFLIRRLHLKVGTVRFINLTSRQPRERALPLDLDVVLENVSDFRQLLRPEVLEPVARAGGDFQGVGPEELGRVLGTWARRGAGLLEQPARAPTETLKSLFEKLEESTKP